MKKFLLAAAALVASASVNAATYLVDDFLSYPNPTTLQVNGAGDTDTTGNLGYTLGGFGYERNILFEALIDAGPTGPGGDLWTGDINLDGNGILSINNGTNVKTRTTLTYDVSSLANVLGPVGAASFAVMFSDGVVFNNPATPGDESLASTSIQAFLNGTSIGLWTLTCPIETSDLSCLPEFAGFQFNANLFTGTNDELKFVINGPAGFDLVVDQIAVVPEPGMLGLFGLGLAGLGFARRRKTA